MPRARAAASTGARGGTPGDFTTAPIPSSAATPSVPSVHEKAAERTSGDPESTPWTRSPRLASSAPAARPERCRPTTSQGPSGSGGRGWCEAIRLMGSSYAIDCW